MAARKEIRVFLEERLLEAYEDGKLKYQFECIIGTDDHPTLPGKFQIFRKQKICRSVKYNAQMNYAMFFEADGKAIHQYHWNFALARVANQVASGAFGSHGCVRLKEEDVAVLFDWAPVGTPVNIFKSKPAKS